MSFDDLDHDDPDGKCMISIGGLLATNHLDSGSKSSQSIAEDGYLILVRAKQNLARNRLFSPFTAFTWQLWVALICTAIAVGVVLWIFDTIVKATFYYVKPAPAEEAVDEAAAAKAVAAEQQAKEEAQAASDAAKNGGANGTAPAAAGKDVEGSVAPGTASTAAAAAEGEKPLTGFRRFRHRAKKLMRRAYSSHGEARATLGARKTRAGKKHDHCLPCCAHSTQALARFSPYPHHNHPRQSQQTRALE